MFFSLSLGLLLLLFLAGRPQIARLAMRFAQYPRFREAVCVAYRGATALASAHRSKGAARDAYAKLRIVFLVLATAASSRGSRMMFEIFNLAQARQCLPARCVWSAQVFALLAVDVISFGSVNYCHLWRATDKESRRDYSWPKQFTWE
jgi:hypothetical protein